MKPVDSKPATDIRKLKTETGRKGMAEHGHEPAEVHGQKCTDNRLSRASRGSIQELGDRRSDQRRAKEAPSNSPALSFGCPQGPANEGLYVKDLDC